MLSNTFQAYRASAKAVKWSGNESVVGLPRTSWNPLGKVRRTDWLPVRPVCDHHLDMVMIALKGDIPRAAAVRSG